MQASAGAFSRVMCNLQHGRKGEKSQTRVGWLSTGTNGPRERQPGRIESAPLYRLHLPQAPLASLWCRSCEQDFHVSQTSTVGFQAAMARGSPGRPREGTPFPKCPAFRVQFPGASLKSVRETLTSSEVTGGTASEHRTCSWD